MKKKVCLLLILLFIGSTQIVKANVIKDEGKKVLYLATGKPNQIGPKLLLKGFQSELGSEYEVYVEYLGDTAYEVGQNPKDLKDCFSEIVEANYKMHGEFDVVVCAGDVAASLLMERYSLVKDAKVVMLNIRDEELVSRARLMGVKVIFQQHSLLKSNIEFIAKMYGSKRRITVLVGPEKYNRKLIAEFKLLEERYLKEGVKLELISLSYKSKSEISDVALSSKKDKSVILLMDPITESLISENKIDNKEVSEIRNLSDILNEICKVQHVPIYSDISGAIKSGMYGGVYVDLTKQGEICAKEVLEIDKITDTVILSSKWAEIQSIDLNKVILSGVIYKKIPESAEKLVNNLAGIYKYENHLFVLILITFVLILGIVYVLYRLEKERKRSEEMTRLKDKAEQINKMKDSLMNNISHELRTPVTVIASSSQLIEKICDKKIEGNKDVIRNANIISQNSYRLMRLINNVIDISNAESDYLTIDKENIEVIGFIEDVVMSVVPFANKKELELVFDTEIEELIMAVDINKLDRIILNLLSNAIKFTNNSGQISVYVSSQNDTLKIEVKDTGIGINKEKLNIIFDKFTQIDTELTRLNEGSGIGLAVVKTFVCLCGGKLTVNSEVGVGSTFIVELPITLIENKDVKYIVDRNTVNTKSELSDIYL